MNSKKYKVEFCFSGPFQPTCATRTAVRLEDGRWWAKRNFVVLNQFLKKLLSNKLPPKSNSHVFNFLPQQFISDQQIISEPLNLGYHLNHLNLLLCDIVLMILFVFVTILFRIVMLLMSGILDVAFNLLP